MTEELQVYTSFDEVPEDDSGVEGDDTVHANENISESLKSLGPQVVTTTAQPTALIVPHRRDLKRGMSGLDVLALKRALIKARGAKFGIALGNHFGGAVERNLKKFQTKNGLKADGVYGLATHRKLAKYYDAYGIRLINKTVIQLPWRAEIYSAAMIAYNNRYKIHYTQGGARMFLVRNHVHDPKDINKYANIYEDCSSFATWLYYQAERPDPNGFGYNGLGYTGTLAAHGHAIPTSSAQIGDMHFYGGYFPYHHVTVNVGGGRCVSHGSEVGPLVTSVWYRSDLRQTRSYA